MNTRLYMIMRILKGVSHFTGCCLLLVVSACHKTETVKEDCAKVTFALVTGEADTKTIADGTNIDILYYEVYGRDAENMSAPYAEGSVEDKDGDGKFLLDLTLIIDQTYTFVFWAQVSGQNHYITDDLRKVLIRSYDDENANDESRAAFYAVKKIHVSKPLSEEITLYRPFSQINIGTSTYETSLNCCDPLMVLTSSMSVDGTAEAFNTLTGKGEGYTRGTFNSAPTPNGVADGSERLLHVNTMDYYWIGMNYLIVAGDADNVDLSMTFETTCGTVELGVENVPVKENYRTNIVGDLLTTGAKFSIYLNDEFIDDEIINM